MKNYWSDEEIELLKKYYFSKSKVFIMDRINRGWCSIQHEAERLGLKRDKKFQFEGMINNTLFNNPMKNELSRLKCSISNSRNGIKRTRDGNRLRLLEQSGFKCSSCGLVKDARKLVIHHKDDDRNNNSYDNFEILCFSCHNKLHNHGGLKFGFEEVISIKKSGFEESFDLHTPFYNNFFLANNVLSHNSGKSLSALTLALNVMNKQLVVEDVCFTTDELLQRAMKIGKSHTLIQDEQINQLGVGSVREDYERQTLEDTTRKFGLNMIFCSPVSREHSTAHYILEVVCINRKRRLTKLALLSDSRTYLGYVVLPVISDDNSLWVEYNRRKDEFIKSVLSRKIRRLSLDEMSEAIENHEHYRFAKTKDDLKIIATKLFPTLNIAELNMIVQNLVMIKRIRLGDEVA